MSKRVLIVNHSYGDRITLRDYLLSFGYHVAGEAKEGRESLEKYKKLRPDLVLLDGKLPDMDGVAVMRELLKEDLDVTVVMCVSRGQRSLAVEALQAGAKDFITKPLDPRRLRKVVQSVIG